MVRQTLIKERINRNLTQKEVAEMIGVSTVYVRKIEKGNKNPGRETMLKFEALYKKDVRILFPELFQVSIDTKCINEVNYA